METDQYIIQNQLKNPRAVYLTYFNLNFALYRFQLFLCCGLWETSALALLQYNTVETYIQYNI